MDKEFLAGRRCSENGHTQEQMRKVVLSLSESDRKRTQEEKFGELNGVRENEMTGNWEESDSEDHHFDEFQSFNKDIIPEDMSQEKAVKTDKGIMNVSGDGELTTAEEGSFVAQLPCHLAENETIKCKEKQHVCDSGGNSGINEEKQMEAEGWAKEDDLVGVASSSDSLLKDGEVDAGIGCSIVGEVVEHGEEMTGLPRNADCPYSDSKAAISDQASNLHCDRDSMECENEAIVLKCNPKKSKGMMSIRRQHSDKLMRNMDQMRRENFLCDVELEAAEGTIFKAHRSVLVAACSYFRAMFSSGLLEGKESRVKMVHLSPKTMATILQFIYTGDLEVRLDEVQELMVVADMLQMEEVIEGCTQLMHDEIEPSNALGIYRFAEAHNCTAMSKMSEIYVKQNFVEVAKGDEFLALPLSTLTFFLSSEGLEVDSEMQVFESAVRWLFHNPPQRRQHVFEVLSHVRLGLLHPDIMSLRAPTAICNGDPPLGVALAAIRMEVEERAKRQHMSRHEDVPRRGAKKHIVVLGGCRREPIPSPYRSPARSSYSSSSHHGEVLCAAVEVFDVFHKEWFGQGGMSHSKTAETNTRGPPPLLNPRILPGVATMGGVIYVVGGELESQILANVEALDARACFLRKGRHLDPIRWTRVSSMVVPRCEFGLCACSGRLYAVGGWVGSDVDSSIESYDPIADEWRLEGNLPKSCSGVGAISYEGLIYIVGGCTRHRRHLSQLLCLEPPSPTISNTRHKSLWCAEPVRLASMNMPRSQMGVAILHDSLYAVGGTNEGSDALRSVERYSFTENKWYEMCPLREARSTPSVVALDGRLYAIGGTSSYQMYHYQTQVSLKSVEMYDPVADVWSPMPSLPHARGEAGAVVI